ncbi:hypothetical protein [Streptococcus merionis]|uniref:hypothetical protein n=1 Tax=Streptococcus merionis TaxID=400065 RepID=UPI0035124AA4
MNNYNIITIDELSVIQGGGGPVKIVTQCIGGAILGVWGGHAGMLLGCAGGVVEAVFD